MEILIFKTNVSSKKKVSRVATLLTAVPTIKQWNFDLEDCDKILRVEAVNLSPLHVESLLQTAGFSCDMLEY